MKEIKKIKPKKKKTKKIKVNFFALIRYLYPVTIIVIIVVLGFLIKFIYDNVYQTIIQAELITDLRKEISDESLEKDKFDKVIENINQKTIPSEIDFSQLKDPFININIE